MRAALDRRLSLCGTAALWLKLLKTKDAIVDTLCINDCVLICERVTKRSKIEVKVSKSSVAIKNIAYTPVLLLIH